MKKKIAIISTHPVQYNAPLFKALADLPGLDVKVFYTWSQAEEGEVYDPGFKKNISWDIPLREGYAYEFIENVSPKPSSVNFNGIINPTLIDTVKNWSPDAILIYGWNYKSHLKLMKYFKGRIPIFFRGDSTLLDEKKVGISKFFRKRFLKWVYSYIDYAFYVGTNNYNYFKVSGIRESQLVFAPHSINDELFTTNHEQHLQKVAEIKKELGIGNEELVFLFAGKLTPKKNPMMLLDSFLQANVSGTHLVIVGNGELEDELKAKAAGIKNVHFIGFQNQTQMPVVYKLADVYILPSKGPDETWGLAVNEAMACGRAVIVSNKVGCAIDLVKENINGNIINSGVGGQLQQLFGAYTKEQAKKYGQASLQIIHNWSLKETARCMYNGIIDKLK